MEKGTVLTVIGNKTDLVEADPDHVTKVKDGSKLAVVCTHQSTCFWLHCSVEFLCCFFLKQLFYFIEDFVNSYFSFILYFLIVSIFYYLSKYIDLYSQ